MKPAKKSRPMFFRNSAIYSQFPNIADYVMRKIGKVIWWNRPQL